ncbi:MAG: hypothetical protein GY832_44630 [Chloroflexi bacterium]|nr:hypothetical protein [Chloroflexota bacterium]
MSTTMQAALQIGRDFVNRARDCFEEEGNLERALYYLDKAQGKADDQLQKEIRDLRRRIDKKQRDQLKSLEKNIQKALAADPFDERAVQALIDQLEDLTSEHDRIQAWRQEAIDKAARWQETQKVAQAKEEIEGLLGRAAALREQGTANQFVIDVYKQAVETASVAQTNYPHNDDVPVLHSRATAEYNQFRAQANLLTTLEQTGEFRQALARLNEHEGDPNKRFAVYERGQLVGQMTASETRRAYIRQASVWVQGKTPEKISDARRTLYEHHAPDAASRILEDFKLMLAGLMPDPERDAIDEFIQEHIAPAQESRDNARRFLGEAASMPQAEIVQAWEKMRQARDKDPHVPNLDGVRKTLIERLAGYVEKQLKDGVQWLNDRQLEQARKSAVVAQAAAALDDSLGDLQRRATGLFQRVQAAIVQADDVKETLEEIESLLSSTTEQEKTSRQATQMWQSLKDRLGDDLALYPQVDKLSARIGQSRDLAQLIASIDVVLKGYDEAAMEDELNSLAKTANRYPMEKGILEKYRVRLEARLAFLEAEREMAVGSLTKARDLYRGATRGDDRGKAEDRLRELERAERRDVEARRDLQRAQSLLGKKPEEAYHLLVRWHNDQQIPSRDAIAEAWHQLVANWRPRIERTLNRLLSASDDLDVMRIQFLVDALSDLEAPQAEVWRQRALPRCHAELAQNLEELENWSGAVEMWQQAVNEASADDLAMYRAKLKNAQLQKGLDEIDPSDHGDDNLKKLQKLGEKHPRSVDVKLSLAKLYLARTEMKAARSSVQSGIALDLDGEYRQDFEQVLKQVDEWEEISGKQARVEQLLALERSTEDYDEAIELAQKTIQDYPHMKAELERWWRELRMSTIVQLETNLDSSGRVSIWEQTEVVGKLLCLEKNHANAKGKLIQLSANVEELNDKVKEHENDPNADNFDGKPEQALGWQLDQVSTLLDQARNATQMLNRFGYFVDGTGDNLARLGTLMQKLTTMADELKKFQTQCSKIRNNLRTAQSSGDWRAINVALIEIKGLGYDEHQTANYFEQLINVIQERRSQLENLKKQIEKDWSQDQFRQVLDGLKRMGNRQTGDPIGEYGIGSSIVLKAQDDGRVLATGINEAERLVKSRKYQVDVMETWLQSLDDVPDWQAVHSEASELVDRGHFDTAIERCQRIVGGPKREFYTWQSNANQKFNDWQQAIKEAMEKNDAGKDGEEIIIPLVSLRAINLEQVIVYLDAPPISPDRLLSRRAEAVWGEASERLAEARKNLEQAELFVKDAQAKKVAWGQAYDKLHHALRALKELEGINPIVSRFKRWRNREQIAQTRESVGLAFDQCKRLCPDHVTLIEIESQL